MLEQVSLIKSYLDLSYELLLNFVWHEKSKQPCGITCRAFTEKHMTKIV